MNKNGDVAEPKVKISNDTSNLMNKNDFDEKTRISDEMLNLIQSQDLGPNGIKFRIKILISVQKMCPYVG